jgi:hypothetical protein
MPSEPIGRRADAPRRRRPKDIAVQARSPEPGEQCAALVDAESRGTAVEILVPIIAGFLLTTVVGGAWATWLQQRAWDNQNQSKLRDEAYQRAAAVCRDVTMLLDRRRYRMQRLLRAVTEADMASDKEVESRRSEYLETLVEWNERLNVNRAIVGANFGDAARVQLDRLYEQYSTAAKAVEAAGSALKLGHDTQPSVATASVYLDPGGVLGEGVYQFSCRLMGQLRDGLVGREAPGASVPTVTRPVRWWWRWDE